MQCVVSYFTLLPLPWLLTPLVGEKQYSDVAVLNVKVSILQYRSTMLGYSHTKIWLTAGLRIPPMHFNGNGVTAALGARSHQKMILPMRVDSAKCISMGMEQKSTWPRHFH